jgi:hypothetical protein
MRESWVKFTAIGHADRYGFGTMAEAVKFANGVKRLCHVRGFYLSIARRAQNATL